MFYPDSMYEEKNMFLNRDMLIRRWYLTHNLIISFSQTMEHKILVVLQYNDLLVSFSSKLGLVEQSRNILTGIEERDYFEYLF